MTLRLILGNKNYSSWSFRPWLALKVAGIPFEETVLPIYIPGAREKILEKTGNQLLWNGGKFFAGPLAEKLEKAGAWDELMALLPKKCEPPVVAVVEGEAA